MTDLDPRLQSVFEQMIEAQHRYTDALKSVEENSELTLARIRWEEADDLYHKLQFEVRKANEVDAKLDAMCKAELNFYEERDRLLGADGSWCNWKRKNEKDEIEDCQCGEHINIPLPPLLTDPSISQKDDIGPMEAIADPSYPMEDVKLASEDEQKAPQEELNDAGV
jgi:hypothetical protein